MEAFSFNREFDFVRLDGLRRATGMPPHEWDLYILKELIDNALDADEALWSDNPQDFPCVNIRVEYSTVPERQSQQLFIQVSNRAPFPVERIADVFATQWYTSRKAFIKGLMRGALGNALKTLLGIPYALRHRVASDWKPDHKPLSILSNDGEYLPRYVVDSTAQTLRFEYEKRTSKAVQGTLVSMGLDHFDQERPRTLTQIKGLAEQYRLCNPHTAFHWTVEIGGQEWIREYEAHPHWRGKFHGIAPVQWYSPTAFQDVLGALYRRDCNANQATALSVETVCCAFTRRDTAVAGMSQEQRAVVRSIETLRQESLTAADIEGPAAMQLYQMLCQSSPRFPSMELGCIGLEHVRTVLTHTLPVEGDILYENATDDGSDPNMPFVIEAAVAHLKDGKRHVWTAINFTPTYSDPFLRCWLQAPIQPGEPVLGLRGVLDAYGLRDDTPVVLFFHLLCPNVEHNEFSKTDINHLPFRHVVGKVLDRLLTALRRAREEAELRLEQTIFRALDAIMEELYENERFVLEQLIERLLVRLRQDPMLAVWLEAPDALSRLRTHIMNYHSHSLTLTHHVARPAAGRLSLPLHPDRHFSVLTEHVSPDLLAQHHVSKILYVQARELEPVIVDNDWLSRMDLALLHNPPSPGDLQEALVQCALGSAQPILILHNADDVGWAVVEHVRTWFQERQLDTRRLIDLGLDRDQRSHGSSQPMRLVEMMPRALATWLVVRFKALGIPAKALPDDTAIRRDIRERAEQFLLGYLWKNLSQCLEVPRFLIDLDRQLHFTEAMIAQALDRQLKNRLQQEECAESYSMVLDEVVRAFFEDFIHDYDANVQVLVQMHLDHIRKSRE